MSNIVISLFDSSANILYPWAVNGYVCLALDINNELKERTFSSGGSITWMKADLRDESWIKKLSALKPCFLSGFPPCTDLAVLGAKHFANKLARDPGCQQRAANLARIVETIGEEAKCAWFAENPVSVLATLWRTPDYYFHPSDYGGYLPLDDKHPHYPEYFPPRDAYNKKTCLWTGGEFIMPEKKQVQPISVKNELTEGGSILFAKLGSKSEKTKRIRSETPRGFSIANFLANSREGVRKDDYLSYFR